MKISKDILTDFTLKITGLIVVILIIILGYYIGFWSNFFHAVNIIVPEIDPQWATSMIAFFAFIIATVSLWFGSLKGPDLVLCEIPSFELREIPKDNFKHYIPNDLSFLPIQLIFLNNGSRSGVLKLELSFKPSKILESHIDKFKYSIRINEVSFEKPPYIVIKERESSIIEVRASLDLFYWKEHFHSNPVKEEDVKDVLTNADQLNEARFETFCESLVSESKIGKISLNSRQTMKKWIFWTQLKDKNLFENLDAGTIDQKLIDNFKISMNKWDEIKPQYILMDVKEINNEIDKKLIDPLKNNHVKLMHIKERLSLETKILEGWKRSYDGYRSKKVIVDFISSCFNFEMMFSKYDSNAFRYNRMKDNLDEHSSEYTVSKVKRQTRDLVTENELLIQKILGMKKILTSCYI
ncbi:hypothetical protein ACFLQ6_00145 [Thermoproteota archaeon]